MIHRWRKRATGVAQRFQSWSAFVKRETETLLKQTSDTDLWCWQLCMKVSFLPSIFLSSATQAFLNTTFVGQAIQTSRSETPRQAYLPGQEVNYDHQGSSSRARLFHCTSGQLTSAISPNVGNSMAQFLLVGICVRANPYLSDHLSISNLHFTSIPLWFLSSLVFYLLFCYWSRQVTDSDTKQRKLFINSNIWRKRSKF